MSTREPDFRHNYAATGVDPGIISNRIGNIFNLNGPRYVNDARGWKRQMLILLP